MTTYPLAVSVDLPLATETTDGLMSAADKVKLDVGSGGGSAGVMSFAGRTGDVFPAYGDYTLDGVPDGVTRKLGGDGSAGVSSFNGRSGDVAPVSGDYTLTLLPDVQAALNAEITLRNNSDVAETTARSAADTALADNLATKANTSDVTTALANKVATSAVGAAGGVASLDSSGKVPTAQLPPLSSPVASVFGRTGAVIAASGDYTLALLPDIQTALATKAAAGDLATEVTNRTAADTAEASARAAADTALTNSLATKANAADLATEVTNRTSAVSAEASARTSADALKVNTSAVGAANGVASLDATGKVPAAQLPANDNPLIIMTASGTLTGPSVIVTGGTTFTLLTAPNIQSIENESAATITASVPAGYTFRSGSTGAIVAGGRGVFQLVAGVNQVKRIV